MNKLILFLISLFLLGSQGFAGVETLIVERCTLPDAIGGRTFSVVSEPTSAGDHTPKYSLKAVTSGTNGNMDITTYYPLNGLVVDNSGDLHFFGNGESREYKVVIDADGKAGARSFIYVRELVGGDAWRTLSQWNYVCEIQSAWLPSSPRP